MKPSRAGRRVENARPQSVAFLIDREGTYVGVDAQDPQALTYSAGEVVGQSVRDLLYLPTPDTMLSIIGRVLDSGESLDYTYTMINRGHIREIRYRSASVSRYDDNTVLWEAIDITGIAPIVACVADMSSNERDVWMLSIQGLTTKEIAEKLSLSARTVTRCRKLSRERFGRIQPKIKKGKNSG